jgi:hypothetical protein
MTGGRQKLMTKDMSFRQRLDAVLRALDVKQGPDFLICLQLERGKSIRQQSARIETLGLTYSFQTCRLLKAPSTALVSLSTYTPTVPDL